MYLLIVPLITVIILLLFEATQLIKNVYNKYVFKFNAYLKLIITYFYETQNTILKNH